MTDKNGFLVVGGDSLVGSGLFRALERRGHRALASTRRRDTLDTQRAAGKSCELKRRIFAPTAGTSTSSASCVPLFLAIRAPIFRIFDPSPWATAAR